MTEHLTLYRFYEDNKTTIGHILHNDMRLCYTLELPDRENKNRISCIPKGIYSPYFIESSASGKYKKVYHIPDVPGRTGVLIHKGNNHRHTLGCILVGNTLFWNAKSQEYQIGYSAKALKVLVDNFVEFKLEIV